MKYTDKEIIELLEAIIEYNKAEKILNTFISAFETYSFTKNDNHTYLHGNYNLGTVKTGRLSSSKPNLTNLPSGSKYGKLVKKCFIAPPNKIMVGADYNALEATCNALVTKDPNKLKVYTDGLDSHCFNTYAYWAEQMPDIENTVDSINSIETKYPKLRKKSKTVTFALQYDGTYYTLTKNSGFSEEEAKMIVERYNNSYQISQQYTINKLQKASSDGYVTGAFGLRLKTPILSKTLFNTSSTPKAAQSEARTAGNMLFQSYGLLNSKTANQFMERVYQSKYKYDITPCAQIHDATYFYIPNIIECIHWVNTNLVEVMENHECKELEHPTIKIGGKLDIFYPNWANEITLENRLTLNQIQEQLKCQPDLLKNNKS